MMPREKLVIALTVLAAAGYYVIDGQLSSAGWVVQSNGQWLLMARSWAMVIPGWPLVLLGAIGGIGAALVGIAGLYERAQGTALRQQLQQARRDVARATEAARIKLAGEYRDKLQQADTARDAALAREAEAIEAIELARQRTEHASARVVEAEAKIQAACARQAAAQGGFERLKRRSGKSAGGGNLNPSKGF